jgi:hypothetical protein
MDTKLVWYGSFSLWGILHRTEIVIEGICVVVKLDIIAKVNVGVISHGIEYVANMILHSGSLVAL